MDFFERLRPHQPLLWGLSLLGLFGVNGVFLYYALLHPDVMAAVWSNPISLAFVIEAFLLMFIGAWVIARAGWRRPGWVAFIVLSLVGSLVFSVPAFVLWHLREARRRQPA